MINLHYVLVTKFYEFIFRKKVKDEKIIYMFHSITDEETNTKEFCSNMHSFEKFIKNELIKNAPTKLSDLISNNTKRGFAITFDDVFENVYTNAYPILKKYHIPFTIFVTTSLLDKPNYLSKQQLIEMASDELCTVGAHTVNHPRLRTCKDSYNDIITSKYNLEKILDKNIEFFAYPFGSIFACSLKNVFQVKRSGFTAAFSTIKGYVPTCAARFNFFLPRNNGDHFVKKIEESEVLK